MDFNMIVSCIVLFVIAAVVWGVAKFFLKLTSKVISIIITAIVAIGLLAILFIFIL
jgi:hypothetical protein